MQMQGQRRHRDRRWGFLSLSPSRHNIPVTIKCIDGPITQGRIAFKISTALGPLACLDTLDSLVGCRSPCTEFANHSWSWRNLHCCEVQGRDVYSSICWKFSRKINLAIATSRSRRRIYSVLNYGVLVASHPCKHVNNIDLNTILYTCCVNNLKL